MASPSGNFVDSLVVIYDNENNYIAKTIITGHNKNEQYIEVVGGLESVKTGTRLHLLIVYQDGCSEFGGTLSGVHKGVGGRLDVFEISLFGERPRDARGAVRHTLNSSAIIREVVVNSKRYALREPVNITIINISTTGVLIMSPELRFVMGSMLRIEVDIHGKETILLGKVVREQRHDDGTHSYGCQLVFLN